MKDWRVIPHATMVSSPGSSCTWKSKDILTALWLSREKGEQSQIEKAAEI